MNIQDKAMILKYHPYIYKDRQEPFPVRCIGCTVFTEAQRSRSFLKWVVDPREAAAEVIIEYAIYYDYDIQHLYDLEHIWVAVDSSGAVVDCWCSFHGMRLRAAGVPWFRIEDTHPVLYAQPGKHAMLPDPALFGLHPQFLSACREKAGGGLLIPDFLKDRITTSQETDEAVDRYIRENFTFTPAFAYEKESLTADQFMEWDELLDKIPQLVAEQLNIMGIA